MQTVAANVFKIYVNLFPCCHSMHYLRIFVQAIQENYVRDTLNWPLSTVFQVRNGTNAVSILFIWSNQFDILDLLISDLQFQNSD